MSSCAQPVRTTVIDCPNLVLTIGFPASCPGPNSVVLANGAVVDLNQLGEILSTYCPSLVCPTNVFVPLSQSGF